MKGVEETRGGGERPEELQQVCRVAIFFKVDWFFLEIENQFGV